MITQTKTKRTWRPGRLEREVAEIGRCDAEKEAARIPWRRLYAAREKYVEWDAFALWVRAIEHTEGGLPDWVAKAIANRCPGFFRFAAEKKVDHPKGAPFFWYHLRRWSHERIFAAPWREGWMNAVGYYAVRDLAYRRNEAYWEYCEREWERSKPAVYPSFREWLKASEQCSDEVLDDYEMREEKGRLIKLMRRVNPRTLRELVTEKGVGESASAIWRKLQKRHEESFGTRQEGEPEIASPVGPVAPSGPLPLVSQPLYAFGMPAAELVRRKSSRRVSTSENQLALFDP